MKTPTITFQVNLALTTQESHFPSPNTIQEAVLHPDRYQEDQSQAVKDIAQLPNLREAYLPGMFPGENKIVKHGDTFTMVGLEALYYKKTYGIGYATEPSRAVLTVVSQVN